MNQVFQDHPRPQLARPRWTDLCGEWQFAHDDAEAGLRERWHERPEAFDRTIVVPFPPESPASGIADRDPHPVVWYRRTFRVPQDHSGGWLLHFGAVDYRASVWVNGRQVVCHEGGHTPFSAEITAVLLPGGGDQDVVVRAEDRPADVAQPRGKQYWGVPPYDIWYHRTTGIWQPVWLEPVGDAYLSELRWTVDLDRGHVALSSALAAPPSQPLTLQVRLTLGDTTLADDTYGMDGAELARQIGIAVGVPSRQRRRHLLWSPGYPNLVEAQLTLRDGDHVLDQVHSYFGLRTASVAAGRFQLNGQPYYPRLVLHQGYWPDTHLAAPSGAALRAEVEAIKELGFNGVRVHQKIEDPRFLYWCDRLGLLVWGEMPSAYVFSTTAAERIVREWLEVLRRDYNHPCVVTWVPFNESWGIDGVSRQQAQQQYVQGVYHLTRGLDPTRPVIGNDGWEHVVTDIWSLHDYVLDGVTLRERYGTPEAVERTLREVQPNYRALAVPGHARTDEPVMLTECGGISLAPPLESPWFSYGTVPDAEAFVAKYAEVIDAILDSETIAGFCYTQLTDVEHETNGLLFADRRPKVDPAVIRRINSRPPGSIPGEGVMANILNVADVSIPPKAE